MKFSRFIPVLAAISFAASCTVEPIVEQPVAPEIETEEVADDPSTISGVVNVQFSSEMADYIASRLGADGASGEAVTKALTDTKASDLAGMMSELGIVSLERIFPDAGKWEPRHREAGLHTWYRVAYDENIPHTKATASLEDIPYICEVEAPHKIKPTGTIIPFNDSFKSYQWNLYNDGKLLGGFKSGADINVVPVWKEYTTGSKDVIVAVVDSGIDLHHEELEGVVIPGTEDGGSRCFVFGHEGLEMSSDGHGTHVSGIIGAINNNGRGICGVAGGSDGTGGVRILGCQMMLEKGEDVLPGDSAAAIVWGADHGAVISQNSWGYGFPDYASARAGYIDSSHKAAVDYFIKYAGFDENGVQVGPMAGGVVFFASGNENWDHGWPAEYEPIIAVGAIGPDGKRASYSNYGDWVDICAPGGEIDRFNSKNEALIVGPAYKEYYLMAGTSQACPHASGVAALLVSYFGGLGFTNKDLKEMIIYGANYNTPAKDENIGPRLDAYGAFTAEPISAPVITTEYKGDYTLKSHESLSVTYAITGTDKIPLKFSFDGGSSAATGVLKDDNTFLMTINALKTIPGKYTATITAAYGADKKTVQKIEYTILENHAPEVVKMIPSTIVEGKSETMTIDMSQYINDPDGEILNYAFDYSVTNVATVTAAGNTVTIRPSGFGSTAITVTATDARGETCTAQPFTFLVYDTSLGFSAYPVPVVDKLNICAGKTKDMKILITGAAGNTVFDGSVTGDSFSPAQINMSSCASGQYSLSVSFGGETYIRNIVKK